MTDARPAQPHGIVDPSLMKGVLAKAARSYGQILAGAGLVDGVLAALWNFLPHAAALVATVVGVVAIVAALLVFGKNNVSTLRELTIVSRTFLLGSALAWAIGLVLWFVVRQTWVWWLLAAVLVALGAWAAMAAFRRARDIEGAPTPSGAVH